ncbi:MAG: glycosyltransferase [Desulfosarcinaceae bacterium]|nr:glycosyltransferase [Desulfosarcinaceae bacterium]
MKIAFYCQHVLGIGHFFRVLELCRALLVEHEVLLVTGGEGVSVALPQGLRRFELPALMMDADFKRVYAAGADRDGTGDVDAIQRDRRRQLMALMRREAPDLLLIELYPFGRKAFRFELEPVLNALATGALPPCRVVCSLRDILVEKSDPAAYERRVLKQLAAFDALLVHGDPAVIPLDETFNAVDQIKIPVIYTGYVTARPSPEAGAVARARMGLGDADRLVVVSAGGGKVGGPLMTAAVGAFQRLVLKEELRIHMHLLTGPYGDPAALRKEAAAVGERLTIERFSDRFLQLLSAADLSVSMGGYNTTMNLLAARVPRALIWPFGQNREQRLRVERLQRRTPLHLLEDANLTPHALAARMATLLTSPPGPSSTVRLDGAETSARWLTDWLATAPKRTTP